MRTKYFVKTGSFLPLHRKVFDCRCTAVEWLKQLLGQLPKDKKLSPIEVAGSICMMQYDFEKESEFNRLFLI